MNWARILAELKQGGYSQEDLESLFKIERGDAGPSQSTISRWAKGTSEPSWSEGRRLLELHAGLRFSTEASQNLCTGE